MLIDEFYDSGEADPNPIRLIAPLWLIEHYHQTDCLDMETFKEIEAIYDDPTDQMEGSLFDSIDGYLNYHDVPDDFFDGEDGWDENEDDWNYDNEEPDCTGIYDRWKQRKRYTVRLELLDAPCTVERTLQIPSNLRLDALSQLLMLSFGRKDSPSEYIYEAGDMLYPNSSCHAFTLGDLLKKKNQSALFNICDREHETHWRHGLTLEKSADYSDRTTSYMTLLDGRGTYPSKNVNDMEAYTRRFLDGKLRQPNFKTVRQHIRDFEEENTIM